MLWMEDPSTEDDDLSALLSTPDVKVSLRSPKLSLAFHTQDSVETDQSQYNMAGTSTLSSPNWPITRDESFNRKPK